MRPLPQNPKHETGREPVHREATARHEARVVHRDSCQQLPAEKGGRCRRGLHQGCVQRRKDCRGQARNEKEVKHFSIIIIIHFGGKA